jgi:hypothetical protein
VGRPVRSLDDEDTNRPFLTVAEGAYGSHAMDVQGNECTVLLGSLGTAAAYAAGVAASAVTIAGTQCVGAPAGAASRRV